MKSNIPWSVKGIDPEAREAAKVAARRAGMTLGEWLNSLILQSGELPEGLLQQIGPLTDEDDDDLLTDEADDGAEAPTASEELQNRLERLSRRLDPSDRNALAVSGIDETIERLASTIENSRRLLASGETTQKTVGELAHRVERIQMRLEEVASQHRTGIEPKTLMALERAIAGVASHIEKSDRRNTELVQSVEDALSQLGTRVDGAELIANDAVGRIDHALDRLGSRIDATENENRRNSARLNEKLSQIDERITHAGSEREATLNTVERRLSSFDNKLQTIQSRVDAAAHARPNIPPDVMTRMEFEDWSRRQVADQGSDSATLKRSVAAIESRLTGVMDRVDRLRSETEGQVRDAERKAEEAMRASQAQVKASDGQTGAAISDLRASLEGIAQKFDRSSHTTTETMSALEGVLRSLTRRLDTLENRQSRAPETAAVAAPEPEVQSDLPRRPTWSWGVARQDETQEQETEIEDVEIEEAPKPRAEVRFERGSVRAGRSGVFEVVEPDVNNTEADRGEDSQSRTVEAIFEPEPEAEQTEKNENEVDLSRLVFDLKGDRRPAHEPEPEPVADEWRERERAEPTIDTDAIENEVPSSTSGEWLEQARRAARTAGPAERISDFDLEDERRTPTRALLITGGVVLGLAAVIAILLIFVRPMLEKSDLFGGKPTSERAAPSTGRPAQSASTTVLPRAASQEPSAQSAEATQPGFGTPAEEDIGQALPGEEESMQPGAPTPSVEPETSENSEALEPETAAPSQSEGPVSAEDAMRTAAEAGNPRAQYALALAYKSGRGVEISATRSLALMTQAANKNLAVAQRTLGIWHEQGDGVAKDLSKAREWYQKAAVNGDVQAMHNLGFFEANGMGGLKKDGAAAMRWFKSAAERGLLASQVNLAIVHTQAAEYGMQPQTDQAYFWSKVAAKHGDVQAQSMSDALAPALPEAVRAQMDEAVAKFEQKPVDIVANGGFDSSPEAFMPADQQPALTRAELTSIQEMLNDLGYNAGSADGRPGGQTVSAIKAFQAAYGLEQTGVASRDLLSALNAVPH